MFKLELNNEHISYQLPPPSVFKKIYHIDFIRFLIVKFLTLMGRLA